MTHDDDFVQQLRHMARSTPPVDVEVADVLRQGRRRRRARTGGISAVAVACVAATAVGVHALLPTLSPAPVAESTASPTSAMGTAAAAGVTFDDRTVVVTEPLDSWTLSDQEAAITDAAQALFVARCMDAAGLDGWDHAADEIAVPVITQDGYATYGLWSITQLDGADYSPRPEPVDVYAGEDSASGYRDLGGDDGATSRACFAEAVAADVAYDLEEVDAVAPAPAGLNPPEYTDDGRAVIREWVQCVRADGVQVTAEEDPLILAPDGAAGADPAERARMASVDIACKKRLGTVRAFADVVAREQNAYIERARDHLAAQKSVQDRVLEASIAYLADQGVSFPEVRLPSDDAGGAPVYDVDMRPEYLQSICSYYLPEEIDPKVNTALGELTGQQATGDTLGEVGDQLLQLMRGVGPDFPDLDAALSDYQQLLAQTPPADAREVAEAQETARKACKAELPWLP